jgi:hypothetical protein
MTEEQRALLIPSKVLFELWYATVFHLFEKNQIDGNALASLLERRQLDNERAGAEEIAQMLKAQIGWLRQIEAGKFSPPTQH